MSKDSISLKYPARPEYIASIRLAVSGVAGVQGTTVDKIEDIKTCVGEACLLLVCSQRCESFVIDIQAGDGFSVTVLGEGAQAIGPCRHCMDFSKEMSRTMIEALSQTCMFEEREGALARVTFRV